MYDLLNCFPLLKPPHIFKPFELNLSGCHLLVFTVCCFLYLVVTNMSVTLWITSSFTQGFIFLLDGVEDKLSNRWNWINRLRNSQQCHWIPLYLDNWSLYSKERGRQGDYNSKRAQILFSTSGFSKLGPGAQPGCTFCFFPLHYTPDSNNQILMISWLFESAV